MKITSRETYRVVRAMLDRKRFSQYEISKNEGITFSLVNRTVNWFMGRGYVRKQKGYYELVSAGAIFNLFPIYRKMTPYATFDVNLPGEKALEMLGKKGVLCLTSALAFYDDYYRDATVHAYLEDEKVLDELKGMAKGFCHVELYREDLNRDDFTKLKRQNATNKIRTVIDLFCCNKAYAAERLLKKEWMSNEGFVLAGHHRSEPQRA